MDILNVILATVVAFGAGAVWYMKLAEPWMAAAGIRRGAEGKPQGGMDPKVMVLTFVMQLVVAGMMRHVFTLGGIDTVGKGLVAGLGIGLFFIAPWIALNYANAMRPFRLTLIDGGYATLACTLMGIVLTLF
ncbi:DUF1761 family protein [Ponticoccus alexandrii]|uniref:DUF1761 family protein n=1 Tax=Ponticoccus alexandrii TaxID=1943633 RepID=A0ABX7FEL9_9RHOB|nr:DUF1761 domain-containing protein [Ponticoccus alexandrii]KID12699.1 hypothetical protein P279_26570 [Rhodobacteraceae bacterium PD-2]QRF68332.1 DUF1761 family protein [Ponticoccus alexandrii]